jgi:hypothetical protein
VNVQNVLGQTVYYQTLQMGANGVDATINLPSSLASGVYMLNLGSGAEARQYRLVVSK